MQRDLRRSKYW